jgi:hypothetical protein
MEEWRYSSTALPPGKQSQLSFVQEAEGAPDVVWMLWRIVT